MENNQTQTQTGLLDRIFEKDNESNKFFLKIIFWISTTITFMFLYLGFKAFILYISMKNAENQIQSGNVSFEQIGSGLGEGANLLLTAKSLNDILKILIIALVLLLLIIYLKCKQENNINKLKQLNYYFAAGLGLFGILEVYSVGMLIKAMTSLTGMFQAATGNVTPNPTLIKWSLIGTFICALVSMILHYFIIFKNKNIGTTDIKNKIDTGVNKVNTMDDTQKDQYKNIILSIVAAIMLYFIAVNFIFVKKVDFNKYYAIQINGVSEYARASFVDKHIKNMKPDEKLTKFLKEGITEFKLSKEESIKNGDTIEGTIIYDKELAKKLKIKVKNDKIKFKVESLNELVSDISEIKNKNTVIEQFIDNIIGNERKNTSNVITKLGTYYRKSESGSIELREIVENKRDGFFGPQLSYDFIEIEYISKNKKGEILEIYNNEENKDNSNWSSLRNRQEAEAQMNIDGFIKY